MTLSADWYFDFVSPFSYLQFKTFENLPDHLEIHCIPVLFAGLLNHWGHKGPAEIPTKRTQTYQYCHWHAQQLGIPFTAPPAHPFNPLKVLRLAVVLGAKRDVVSQIFDFIWSEGNDVHTPEGFDALLSRMRLTNADEQISSVNGKNVLRQNTERAIEVGVYGVPTFSIDNQLFWGLDRTAMMLDYLENPSMMQTSDMRRLENIEKAAARIF